MELQTNYTDQPVHQPAIVDLTPLIEHGDSPTAIILALAFFTGVVLKSISSLKNS